MTLVVHRLDGEIDRLVDFLKLEIEVGTTMVAAARQPCTSDETRARRLRHATAALHAVERYLWRARAELPVFDEITFNAAQSAELRTIGFVNQLIDQGRLSRGAGRGDCRRIRLHRVEMPDLGESLDFADSLSSVFSGSWAGLFQWQPATKAIRAGEVRCMRATLRRRPLNSG